MLFAVHYVEKNITVLNQCLRQLPKVDEAIKIKGRKGKVISVTEVEKNKYHVHVALEKISRHKLPKDDKKKRR